MSSPTEARNPATTHIDRASTEEMLRLIQAENRRSLDAVEEALPRVAEAVEAAAAAVAAGGRILYVGAGTSGRLAVVDASECPPTFGTDPGQVTALIAGGAPAILRAVEGAEDDAAQGAADVAALRPSEKDFVLGIAASGNTPYVLGALCAAREAGCVTAALSCNPEGKMNRAADIAILTDTGAEVITGSTRLKAGNAQKMVLNMISTCAMVKTGKVYENFMINLRPTNEKLRNRMIGIVATLCQTSPAEAEAKLSANDFSVRRVLEAEYFGKEERTL